MVNDHHNCIVWAISGSDSFPSEPCFGPKGPDGARRIARLSRISVRLMYGPIWDPTASPRALWSPFGTQRPPGGPPAAPSDPLHRSLPGLGGPQLLLVQPRLLITLAIAQSELWHLTSSSLSRPQTEATHGAIDLCGGSCSGNCATRSGQHAQAQRWPRHAQAQIMHAQAQPHLIASRRPPCSTRFTPPRLLGPMR